MQSILQSKYYNLGENKAGKYLVQTRPQAKSSSIKLPEVHGIGKGLDPNVLPEKQAKHPIAAIKTKDVSQVRPRVGQGIAGLKRKIKTPIPTLINKPIADLTKRQVPNAQPVEQPKLVSKITLIPDYAIPQMKHRGNTSSGKNHAGY